MSEAIEEAMGWPHAMLGACLFGASATARGSRLMALLARGGGDDQDGQRDSHAVFARPIDRRLDKGYQTT